MALDVDLIRDHFPALKRPAIFFDNPGGTQIARESLGRIHAYLVESNANHDGAFPTSRESDEILREAHRAMADLLNASRPEEIVFGANMTSLTFALSHALAHEMAAGDTIVVTRMDHDANISPWLRLAEDRGCRVRWVDFHPEDGSLDLDDYRKALEERPRLVAFCYASNALGTINPVARMIEMAHQAGALVFVDAVQYAPHGPIDVQQIEADFLACSAYKFFGPHIGVLYGRYDLLDRLPAYKVRPAPDTPPGKWETGTQSHEGIAGVLGAVEYLAWIGETFGQDQLEKYGETYTGRKLVLKQAMGALRAYEYELSRALLEALEEIPGATLYGPKDERRLERRVPTFAFTLQGMYPREVAERLGNQGIYVWDGHYYAVAVVERLGLSGKGGMVRVGAAHYNTLSEVARLRDTLGRLG